MKYLPCRPIHKSNSAIDLSAQNTQSDFERYLDQALASEKKNRPLKPNLHTAPLIRPSAISVLVDCR